MVRPRGVSGVFRSRLPLRLQLRLAAQQNRLLWFAPGFFAVLAPPTGHRDRTGSWWLRWLDRWWDLLMFFLPALVLVTAGAVAAVVWTQRAGGTDTAARVALACAVATMAYVSVLMIVLVVRNAGDLYRTIVPGRSEEATTAGIGQVLTTHWSLSLVHAPDAAAVPALLTAVRSRIGGDLLCPEAAVTGAEVRDALRRQPHVDVFTAHPPVLIVRHDPGTPVTPLPVPADVPGHPLHGIALLLAGMAAIILSAADDVAGWERDHCARRPPHRCEEQPLTYGDALYWLLNRLSGGDPEGLGAQSFQARSIGLLITLMSVVIVGWVITP